MFSKANLQTFRFIPQRTSIEFAEKRNAVEQNVLDKKIKVFENGRKHVRQELASIKKEKYSRNFYKSSPHVKEEKSKHSRFVEVVVSTSNKGSVKQNNSSSQRAELYNKGKQNPSDNNGSTNRKGLLTASGVGRTITSMRRAANALDISLTPGQVVRVSCPAELEEKVKTQKPQPAGPSASYLSRRRHGSVAIGAGIACNRGPDICTSENKVEEAHERTISFQTRFNTKNVRRNSLPAVIEIESCSEDDDTVLHENDSSSGTSSPSEYKTSLKDTQYLFPGRGEFFSKLAIRARRPLSAKSIETRSRCSSSESSGDEDDVDSKVFHEGDDFYGYCEENEANRKNIIPAAGEKLLVKRNESRPPRLTSTCLNKPMKKTRSQSIPTILSSSWPRTPTQHNNDNKPTKQNTQESHEEKTARFPVFPSNSCSDDSPDISRKRDLESTNIKVENNKRKEIQGIRAMGHHNTIDESDNSFQGSPLTRRGDCESGPGSPPQSPRLLNERQEYNGRRRRLKSEPSVMTDLSENEKIVLRQTMLKRLEIQEGIAKAQRISQQHFGNSKNKNKNPQVLKVASARTSTGIKATDLSNRSNRRWKNFIRRNNRTLENMLDDVTDVTKCRYLRCDNDDY